MITVNELLEHCIEYEHRVVAHAVFWALSNGYVKGDDDSKKLDDIEHDQTAIEALVQQNILGLGQIKLYVVPAKNDWFAFYFSSSGIEVSTLHKQLFGEFPSRIIDAERLIYKVMYIEQANDELALIEYRKKLVTLPAYIGHAKQNTNILRKFERNVVRNVV